MIQEIWKDIKNYEGKYQASNTGKIRSLNRYVKHSSGSFSLKKANILKSAYNKGYLFVGLCNNGVRSHKRIHRLIAQAFIPNPENYPYINHKNGIKDDNRVENLEWVSQSMNIKHAFAMGLISRKGEKHHLAKLNNKKIRLKLSQGFNCANIAKEYCVSVKCINDIKNYKRWKHLN